MKKVSVIVPIYKTEKYINRCIESIVDQSYKNLEILLIDDGSPDDCPKICDKWAKKDKRIICIHKENGGVSSARNIGLDKATGYYIAFVDSDDYLDNKIIENFVNSIEKNDSDLAICNFYPNGDMNVKECFFKDDFYNLLFDKNLYRGYIWNKFYKSSILKKNNIKFEKNIHICEDVLFNCLYVNYCNKISFINKKMYYYNDDSVSALNSKINDKFLSVFEAYKKIEKIYKSNNVDMNEFYISYFKVITDVIYRNHISNNITPKKDLNIRKKEIYRLINKKENTN